MVDLKDAAATTKAAQDAITALGSLQTLVSNAGILRAKRFEDTTLDDWDDHLNINLRPAFVLIKAVFPSFREQGGGVVLMTTSASGIRGFLGEAGLCPLQARAGRLDESAVNGA